jgi:uncharacterized membrane protein
MSMTVGESIRILQTYNEDVGKDVTESMLENKKFLGLLIIMVVIVIVVIVVFVSMYISSLKKQEETMEIFVDEDGIVIDPLMIID